MSESKKRRGRWRWTVLLLLASGVIIAGAGCGKRDGQDPQGPLTATEQPSGKIASAARESARPVTSSGDFSGFVVPSVPSRISTPTVSVKSRPGREAEVIQVRWFVNGSEQEDGPRLSISRFQREDRIRAEVKLRAGGEEILLTTPEVVAVNALPGVTDVRIEPQTLTNGGTARAVVQAQDPDGDPLTFRYRWYVNDLPVTADGDSLTLSGVKKGSWLHVAATPNDGFSDGAWKYSPRHQVVNSPPVVKSKLPKELPPGRKFVYRIVAEDADGDPLSYSLSNGPPGMRLEGSTLVWQVPEESIGANVGAEVVISDDDGGQTIQSISMTIQPPK